MKSIIPSENRAASGPSRPWHPAGTQGRRLVLRPAEKKHLSGRLLSSWWQLASFRRCCQDASARPSRVWRRRTAWTVLERSWLVAYASSSVDRRGQAHRARSFCRAALKNLREHPHCVPRATCERGAASASTELCQFSTAWTNSH